jgi:hypothetical protein
VYEQALKRAVKRAMAHDVSAEKKRQKKLAKGLPSTAATPATTTPGTPVRRDSEAGEEKSRRPDAVVLDMKKTDVVVKQGWWKFGRKKEVEGHEEIRPTLRDVNPFPTMLSIFKRPTNALILFSSGTSALSLSPSP